VLHELGWAGGTSTDDEQVDSCVMDPRLDGYFYSATAKSHVWGDTPAHYYKHINEIRHHLGYEEHPDTPH